MATRLLLIAGVCLLAQLANAQSVPSRSFMLGPSVGFDQVSYINGTGYVRAPTYSSPTGLNLGIDAAYHVNRLLFGAKVLYTNRLSRSDSPPNPPNPEDYISAVETDLHVLTVPLSISYRLMREGRFRWYVGANIAAEYLLSTSKSRLYGGTYSLGDLQFNKSNFGRPLNIGYGAQTTLQYQLIPHISLQVEPALRYYPSGGFPIRGYSSYQFQGAFSILFKV